MKFKMEIDRDDIDEHITQLWADIEGGGLGSILVSVAIWCVAGTVFIYFLGPIEISHVVLFFLVIAVYAGTEGIGQKRVKRKMISDEANPALGLQTVDLTDEGVRHSSSRGEGIVYWSAILRFGETPRLYQLFVGDCAAILIPKRYIENEEDFSNAIREWRAAA